mgnify:FL=1
MKYIVTLLTCIIMSSAISQDIIYNQVDDLYNQAKIMVVNNPKTEVENTYHYNETCPTNEVSYKLINNDFQIIITDWLLETKLIILDQYGEILLFDENFNGKIDENDNIMAHDKNTSSEYYYQGYMGKNKRYYAINNKEYPINDIYPFFAIRIDNHDKSRRHVYVFTDTRVIPPPLEMITSLLKSVIKSFL